MRQVRKDITEIPAVAPGVAPLLRLDRDLAWKRTALTQINEISGPTR
jgi:hypothetical protein